MIDLSANENPFGPSAYAVHAIIDGALSAHRYPDGGGIALKEALASLLAIGMDQIVLGNGSCEVLELTARALLGRGDEAVLGWPSFPAYRSIIARTGATAVLVPLVEQAYDLDGMAAAVTSRTRLVVLGNPNNPTGLTIRHAAFAAFLNRLPKTVAVVVDEAYREYVGGDGLADALAWIAEGRTVVVTRSLSKAYGLAGLRIGYAAAPAALARRIETQRQHFNTSRIAQAAALAAIGDRHHLTHCVALNTSGRRWLENQLAALGLHFLPSEANFIMLRVGDGSRICQRLRGSGIQVKPLDALDRPEWIRVSVGRPEENERFIAALVSALSQPAAVEQAC